MAKRWVKLKEDYKLVMGGVRVEPPQVEEGSVGFILPKTCKEEWSNVPEGFVPVKFPQTHGWLFPLSVLEDLPILPVEEAIKIIREYEGHHTNRGGQFQFNIKVYGIPKLPDAVEHGMTLQQKNEAWDEIMSNELRNLVDKDYCDGVLSDDFDWVSEDKWYTAGRSGGWLVLTHVNQWGSGTCAGFYEDRRTDVLNSVERLQDLIYDNEEKHISEREYDECQQEITGFMSALREDEADISDLARDLEMIDAIIRRVKDGIPKYMSTMECWEQYMPTFECAICLGEFPGQPQLACEECNEFVENLKRERIAAREGVTK